MITTGTSSADAVAALIARLEQRAADGEEFARIALSGWRAELRSLMRGGDATTEEATDDGVTMQIKGVQAK